MSLSSQLERWTSAGLIDAATAKRIAEYEQGQEKPTLLYALGGLGGLTIGLGAISLVAANWDGIGFETKLAVDLVVLAGLAIATFVSVARGFSLAREILISIYYLFTIASLALIGQIYQSSAPVYWVFVAWSLATLPLMLFAESRVLGVIWTLGLAATEFSVTGFESSYATVAPFVMVSPLLYIVFGRLLVLSADRRQVGGAISAFGWLALIALSAAQSMLWYLRSHLHDPPRVVIAYGAAVLMFIVVFDRLYPDMRRLQRYALTLWLLVSAASLAAHASLTSGDYPIIGASVQISLLAILAFAAAQADRLQSFNLLTGLLALRLLVLYFEAFGSLLDTGLAMISGGILTLVLAWIWRSVSPTLARRLSSMEN